MHRVILAALLSLLFVACAEEPGEEKFDQPAATAAIEESRKSAPEVTAQTNELVKVPAGCVAMLVPSASIDASKFEAIKQIAESNYMDCIERAAIKAEAAEAVLLAKLEAQDVEAHKIYRDHKNTNGSPENLERLKKEHLALSGFLAELKEVDDEYLERRSEAHRLMMATIEMARARVKH